MCIVLYQEIANLSQVASGAPRFSDVFNADLQRGYSEDAAEVDELSPRGSHAVLMKTRSTDHLSGVEHATLSAATQRSLRSATSDDALGKKDMGPDAIPPVEPERKRRGKSPFRFFRKSTDKKEPDIPGPTNYMNGELMTERKGPVTMTQLAAQTVPLIATPQITERRPSAIKPASSRLKLDAEKGGEPMEQLDSSCLELLDEYFYGVRIFPGQDPNHVFCGWVTTTYKQHDNSAFENSKVRKVTFVGLSEDGTNKEVLERHDCYLVSAGQLLTEVSQESRTSNQGMFVGCHVDLALGTLTFTAEGRPSRTVFRVEPGTKLFPAAFFEATSKEVLQFELGRTPTTLPLSAALLQTTGKHVVPQCPPRLKVQCLQRHSWARVPDKSLRPHALKLSDIRGWSLLCEDPVSMLAVHIPEEDRCIDILELIEQERLLSFHAHTLVLYGALCFQGNHRAAHTICGHVDAKQLLYAIQNQYLSGPLRLRFADLLISLHLESFAYARTLTQNEFIIPLGSELKEMYESVESTHQLTTLQSVSLRPEVVMSHIQTDVTSIKDLSTPYFPLDELKNFVMEALQSAVYLNNFPMRDPIGGSNTCLFVPIIKLVDKLLLIGFLEDYDLESLLILIDPETFDPEYNPENGTHGPPLKGLMQMQLEEGPKLELCHALHHLLGIQLRHRVEGLVAFCRGFVSELQSDQLRRYISIKQEDLPAAVAARKTREFRCAPKDQMRAILSFKTIDEEGGAIDQCPCGDPLRETMRNFHEVLTAKMKTVLQAPEEEGAEAEENGSAPSATSKVAVWGKKLLTLIKLFKAQVGDEEEKEEGKVEIPQGPEDPFVRKIVTTITSWAEGSEIENTQLVREMFRLLLRLYNSPGEMINALGTTYVLGENSKSDILRLLEDLEKVRSLLPVQMEPEEEEVMRTSLWAMVNNRVFFQHPDLIRILKVHEDVIAVMMNTLGKRAQQTSESPEKVLHSSTARESPHPGYLHMASWWSRGGSPGPCRRAAVGR
ncbi:RYR2 [Cordylochernes scorpioides]|uniref:RYR2 n=1 Tax=Cordylochernes scorpioides TaxID=51811 RepID=A0ABY6K936_9ARAC|nr:RYR2 [Cordylochernes scorpioides]